MQQMYKADILGQKYTGTATQNNDTWCFILFFHVNKLIVGPR